MNKLRDKNRITSLELLEQINIFRKKESRSELQHKDLLKIIREEFFEEIGERKISPTSELDNNKIYEVTYKDQWNRKQPMFILTLSQAKQVLTRESKTVRKAVFKYIDELEKKYITAVKILNKKKVLNG